MSDAGQPVEPAEVSPGARLAAGREGPYGPIAPEARLTYVWASPFVQFGLYIAANVPALVIVGEDLLVFDSLPPERALQVLLVLLVVPFPLWALLVALWVKGFERRSLASAGFCGPNGLRRYGVGVLAGIGVAVVLAALSPFAVPEDVLEGALEATTFEPGRVLQPDWLLTIVGVAALFLMQGACEEIAFRGWMMSAIAARRGLVLGVLINIVLFGLLHAQFLASGPLAAAAAIGAITCVGLFMSLWAIAERSIAGVCGVHGAFNATLVILGLVAGGASSPEATPGEVLLDTIKQATALEGDASVAGALLQLVVFAALSGLVWRSLRRRR